MQSQTSASPTGPVGIPNTAKTTPAPPVAPPSPPDTFNRYGKIWVPSNDIAHPLKLNLQFPGIGEMKIPSQDELNVRDKLEQLATLSDADIRTQLDQWPPYAKMKLGDEGQMLVRIQQFKDLRTKTAAQKAHDLGLLTLTPDQKQQFEKDYWDKQLQMDRELAQQFEPILKARQQKMWGELFREFSSSSLSGPPSQPTKPMTASTSPYPAPGPVAAPMPQNPTH
jgi:hypothetical protein